MINIDQKWQNLIKDEIKKLLPNIKIFIFGSRSRRENYEYSDIDIALQNEEGINKKIDKKIISLIKFNIEETIIPFKIDLIDLNNCDEDFTLKIQKDLVEI